MPSVGAVGRKRRNVDDERIAWVAARWFSRSFRGTFLNLLNLRGQYLQFQFSTIWIAPGLSTYYLTKPSMSISRRLETTDIRDSETALRREKVSAKARITRRRKPSQATLLTLRMSRGRRFDHICAVATLNRSKIPKYRCTSISHPLLSDYRCAFPPQPDVICAANREQTLSPNFTLIGKVVSRLDELTIHPRHCPYQFLLEHSQIISTVISYLRPALLSATTHPSGVNLHWWWNMGETNG